MRPSLLLALPALALAVEQQQPLGDRLKNWWNKATSYVESTVPSSIPNPVEAATAKVAEIAVTDLTAANWKDVLTPGDAKFTGAPSEWLIYVHGTNKTCYDNCANATKAWNAAIPVLAVLPSGPSLASIDSDKEAILSHQWSLAPPAIYHILLSQTEEPVARWIQLNQTEVKASDIVELHTKRTYEKTEPYTGAFQPWTGWLAKTQLNIPFAYVMWAFAMLPPWAPMIIVSFLSRTLIRSRGPQPARAAPGTAAPAPAS